jgi:hypothetical protein
MSSVVRMVGLSSAMPPRATNALQGSLLLILSPLGLREVFVRAFLGCDASPFWAEGRESPPSARGRPRERLAWRATDAG